MNDLSIKLLFLNKAVILNRANQMISCFVVLWKSCLVLNLEGKEEEKGLHLRLSKSAIHI